MVVGTQRGEGLLPLGVHTVLEVVLLFLLLGSGPDPGLEVGVRHGNEGPGLLVGPRGGSGSSHHGCLHQVAWHGFRAEHADAASPVGRLVKGVGPGPHLAHGIPVGLQDHERMPGRQVGGRVGVLVWVVRLGCHGPILAGPDGRGHRGCPGQESNLYAPWGAAGFKPAASTSSATRAPDHASHHPTDAIVSGG